MFDNAEVKLVSLKNCFDETLWCFSIEVNDWNDKIFIPVLIVFDNFETIKLLEAFAGFVNSCLSGFLFSNIISKLFSLKDLVLFSISLNVESKYDELI